MAKPKTPARVDPRVARSRAAILAAATTAFLRDGYSATTMDMIAAEARVSKRTVYNNFHDKEALFREVTLGATEIAEDFATQLAAELADPDDLEAALLNLARRLSERAGDLRVVRLRHLLIGEAHRFPDLAAEYYRLAPGRVIATLAEAFDSLADRGRLDITDPTRAAEHFAFLTLGHTLDRAMFDGRDRTQKTDAQRRADDGVRAFLAVYQPRPERRSPGA